MYYNIKNEFARKKKIIYKPGHPRFEKLSRYEYHKLTSSEESPRRVPP